MGVDFLLNDLLVFSEGHKTQDRLFATVFSDLNVLAFQARDRTSGIVTKTETLW